MNRIIEQIRICIPYATDTGEVAQLEDVLDIEIDRRLAESEAAVLEAESVLLRARRAVGASAIDYLEITRD